MRERDQSLAVQMANLTKKQASRDKRRMEQKLRSAANRRKEDGGDSDSEKPLESRTGCRTGANATGGLSLGRSAAEAVAEAARLSEAVTVFRCDVCQVSYKSEAQYRMHIAGAAHRKAVAKAEEDRQRALRGGAAAEAALAAAGWQNRSGAYEQQDPAQWLAPGPAPGRAAPRGGRGAPRGRGRPPPRSEDPVPQPVRTHADVVRELQSGCEKGPLDLDGWVPPLVEASPPPGEGDSSEEPLEAEGPLKGERDGAGSPGPPLGAEAGLCSEEGKEESKGALLGMVGGYGGDSEDEGSSGSGSSDPGGEIPPGTSFF
uniref:C2H2-type domain-containing protein n=1 Tax=Tetraselmis sp. GSL018 TaxID=582737 RepID=A0A061S241_9CHLO|mmetsp:Transcript_26673/g.63216  ORF Transcript_26673/g.63216 Transcript_26673/m.63216 type:complete len:316 (+) Transcript_26673:254-1201(+)